MGSDGWGVGAGAAGMPEAVMERMSVRVHTPQAGLQEVVLQRLLRELAELIARPGGCSRHKGDATQDSGRCGNDAVRDADAAEVLAARQRVLVPRQRGTAIRGGRQRCAPLRGPCVGVTYEKPAAPAASKATAAVASCDDIQRIDVASRRRVGSWAHDEQ